MWISCYNSNFEGPLTRHTNTEFKITAVWLCGIHLMPLNYFLFFFFFFEIMLSNSFQSIPHARMRLYSNTILKIIYTPLRINAVKTMHVLMRNETLLHIYTTAIYNFGPKILFRFFFLGLLLYQGFHSSSLQCTSRKHNRIHGTFWLDENTEIMKFEREMKKYLM